MVSLSMDICIQLTVAFTGEHSSHVDKTSSFSLVALSISYFNVR